MRTIYKYFLIAPRAELRLARGAVVVSVQSEGETPVLYVLHETVEPTMQRTFIGYATGKAISNDARIDYIGTTKTRSGLVWHIFEENRPLSLHGPSVG